MKALITYSDWLLLERGEIKPEIGDVTEYGIVTNIFNDNFVDIDNSPQYVDEIYVEVEYNPNQEQYDQFKSTKRKFQH